MEWDSTTRLGVWPFSVTLEKHHPFYYIVADHDRGYDEIRNGTATFTLAELDRNFLKNGLVAAWQYPLALDRFWVRQQVWIAYGLCRAWAKYQRPELEAWRPGDPPPVIKLKKENIVL